MERKQDFIQLPTQLQRDSGLPAVVTVGAARRTVAAFARAAEALDDSAVAVQAETGTPSAALWAQRQKAAKYMGIASNIAALCPDGYPQQVASL